MRAILNGKYLSIASDSLTIQVNFGKCRIVKTAYGVRLVYGEFDFIEIFLTSLLCTIEGDEIAGVLPYNTIGDLYAAYITAQQAITSGGGGGGAIGWDDMLAVNQQQQQGRNVDLNGCSLGFLNGELQLGELHLFGGGLFWNEDQSRIDNGGNFLQYNNDSGSYSIYKSNNEFYVADGGGDYWFYATKTNIKGYNSDDGGDFFEATKGGVLRSYNSGNGNEVFRSDNGVLNLYNQYGDSTFKAGGAEIIGYNNDVDVFFAATNNGVRTLNGSPEWFTEIQSPFWKIGDAEYMGEGNRNSTHFVYVTVGGNTLALLATNAF